MSALGARPAESHAEHSEVWGRQKGEALVPPASRQLQNHPQQLLFRNLLRAILLVKWNKC